MGSERVLAYNRELSPLTFDLDEIPVAVEGLILQNIPAKEKALGERLMDSQRYQRSVKAASLVYHYSLQL
jgi:hypothetical protein